MTDGKVPADERLRLVNLHGAEEASRLIDAAEAEAAPPEPKKGKAAPTSEQE